MNVKNIFMEELKQIKKGNKGTNYFTFIEDIIFHWGRFDLNENISLQISPNIYHWTLQCEVFYFLHLSDQFISINILILMCSLVSNIYITLNNATKYPSGYQIIVVIPILDYLNRGNSFKDHI